jgi:enamine deaminase RidA (YjgF/YER057c/UK114 family)
MTISKRVYTGSPWEQRVAYCRARRVGDFIAVSGTVAVGDDGTVVGEGDVYAQALFAMRRIEKAIRELGGELRHVVRTRTFLTDMSRFEDFARAHGEVFAGIDPAASALGVTALVGSQFLVEIEADAIVAD